MFTMKKRNLTKPLHALILVVQIAFLILAYRFTSGTDDVRALRGFEVGMMENRIPAGSNMKTGRYPFFTVIKVFAPSQDMIPPCVGSLIAPDVVLTSASCFQATDITSVEVWVNTTSPFKYIENEHFRKATRWVVYPGEQKDDARRPVVNEYFDPRSNSHRISTCTSAGYDIALIFLDAPVVGVPLVLLNRDASFSGETSTHRLTAIGIDVSVDRDEYSDGYSYDSGSMAPIDHFAEASANSTPALACWKEYGSKNFNQKSQLCARIEHKRSGQSRNLFSRTSSFSSCALLGVPLLLQSSSAEKDVQVGITTRCQPQRMTTNIYTSVGFFAEWIDDQICLFSTSKPSTCQTGELKAAS